MEDFTKLVQLEANIMARRLRGMAMISRGIVPNLVISQRVVDRVVEAAKSYLADETGETMVGLVLDSRADDPEAMPTMYVLDTIAPDESTIRRSHMFEQGDDLQGDIFVWLLENWYTYLDLGKDMASKPIREEWKTPLKHLGDWHKQPGFMIQPSGGDLMTALRTMDDEENEFDFLLVPIVTLGHETVTSEEGATVNYFMVPLEDGTSLRMDWWYIHRDVRIFQPITPRIVPATELPELTPYPWYLLDSDLLEEEIKLLEEDGAFLIGTTTILWEADGDLPLEICLMVGRQGSGDVYLVVTDWNYPRAKPRLRRAPFEGVDATMYIYDVFAQLWEKSEPVEDPPGFEWNPDKSYIVDYIAAIELHEGKRSTLPTQEAVAIPVTTAGEEAVEATLAEATEAPETETDGTEPEQASAASEADNTASETTTSKAEPTEKEEEAT